MQLTERIARALCREFAKGYYQSEECIHKYDEEYWSKYLPKAEALLKEHLIEQDAPMQWVDFEVESNHGKHIPTYVLSLVHKDPTSL